MKKIGGTMKRVFFSLLVGIFALMPSTAVASATESTDASGVVIRQVYLGSTSDASDEFVIVSNTSVTGVDIGGMFIEYKAATGKSWYEKAEVAPSFVLAAGQDYVLATKREHDAELSGGFAQSGGNLRVVTASGKVLDALAWGNGDSPEETVVSAPSLGGVLTRKMDGTGQLLDTQNNAVDFEVSNLDGVEKGTAELQPRISVPDGMISDAAVEITELLPDPASPASDSSDEFIELFNAGGKLVVLDGWKLRDAAGHTALLDGVSLQPGQYLALMSSQTKLSLNNSGDTVALINPVGEIIMTTPDYGTAEAGVAYGVSSDGWGWLAVSTPNSMNSSLAIQDVAATIKEGKTNKTTKTSKKKATVKSAKKKAAATKSKTPKLAKTASASAAGSSTDLVDSQAESVPWAWLVAGLGVIAVGYGVYEYRPEIISFITKLRAKFSARS